MGQGVQTLSLPQGADLQTTIAAANRALQALGVAVLQVQGAFDSSGGPSTGPYSVYPLAANSVGSTQIDAGAVINSKIAANAVQTANILAGAVTTLKIANAAVTNAQVAVNTLTGGLTGALAVGTITNDNLVSATIQAGSIAANTILGGNIAANTITGGNIAAATITAGKLNVLQLSAITADMGAITAGTIVMSTTGFVRGGQTGYATGTGWWLGFNSTAYMLSIGSGTNFLKWDSTNLLVQGGSGSNLVNITSSGFSVGSSSGFQILMGAYIGNPAALTFANAGTFVGGFWQQGVVQNFQLGSTNGNQIFTSNSTTGNCTGQLFNSVTSNVIQFNTDNLGGSGSPGMAVIGTSVVGSAFYLSNQLSIQGASGTTPFTLNNPYAGMAQFTVPANASPYIISLRKIRTSNNDAGILFTNDFWNNTTGVGTAGIVSIDTGASGGDLHFRTTRNGGGATGVPTDSLVILNDGTVRILNNSGAPGVPTGSGYLYVSAGVLHYKGSAGTDTTVAPA